jgi:hypothetical protein
MNKKLVVLCAIAVLALLMAGTARADGLPITNTSFETPGGALAYNCGTGCAYNYTPPSGWNVTMGGSFEPGPYFDSVPDGSLVAFTNGGSISQTLTSSVASNTLYTLTVDVGERTDQINGEFTIYLDTIQNGVITTLCSVTGQASSIAPGTWQAESCSYESGSNVPAGNFFLDFVAYSEQLDVDNVVLTDPPASVPEPGSMPLLGFGMVLVMCVAMWSKRKELQLGA